MYCSDAPEDYDVDGLEVREYYSLTKFVGQLLSLDCYRCLQEAILDQKVQEIP